MDSTDVKKELACVSGVCEIDDVHTDASVVESNYRKKLHVRKILRPIFFWFDPERIHDFFAAVGELLGSNPLTRWIVSASCDYEHPSLATRVAGIDFKNPVGLGAGFDKDVRLTKIMPSVGFGFMEVGAITHFPYEGNKGPRLARLPDDRSLIVYYGLKNYGAEAIRKKMEHLHPDIPVGVNIAKTNRADIKGEKSVEDYVAVVQDARAILFVCDAERLVSERAGRVHVPGSADARRSSLRRLPRSARGCVADLPQDLEPSFRAGGGCDPGGRQKISVRRPDLWSRILRSDREHVCVCGLTADELGVIPAGGISGAPIKTAFHGHDPAYL